MFTSLTNITIYVMYFFGLPENITTYVMYFFGLPENITEMLCNSLDYPKT